MKNKILIACEKSQIITKAFRDLGFENTFSSDIQEPEINKDWHIQGDVREVLDNNWDLIIAHPDCTYITNSGVTWLYNKDSTRNEERWQKLDEACEFFKLFLDNKCPLILVENPIPHKYALERIGKKYDQLIQPYHFGHMERKATCFWLKGLPPLQPTNNVKEEMLKLPKNQQQRLHYLPPSKERANLRSRTFDGVGRAIATQYSQFILNKNK